MDTIITDESTNIELIVEPTQEKAKSIQVIDKTTVHRICSGQVVLNLSTAVKELVENALDAGATSIEVKMQDQGSTSLEISDNGRGVHPIDFEGLALKHHTSKLKDFEDLVGVRTFGFRGEALSSLSALGNLSITTRCASEHMGTELTFCHNGTLIKRKSTPRQIGTTVTLRKIFYSLPVRHKEFMKNLKKEFNKMVQILYSYCIISTNVRIHCTNQNSGKTRNVIVSTVGQKSLKENLASIFTAKQVASLLSIRQNAAANKVLEEYGLNTSQSSEGNAMFTFEGLISSCEHGLGRSSADRQFFFINNRPCDPEKIKSLVNGVYHSYNRHQFPVVVIHVKTQQDNIDINVTPDKRKILVSQEKLLLAALKSSLVDLFEAVLPSIDRTSLLGGQSVLPVSFSSPKQDPLSRHTSTPSSVSRLSQFSRSSQSESGLKRSRSMVQFVDLSPVKKVSKMEDRCTERSSANPSPQKDESLNTLSSSTFNDSSESGNYSISCSEYSFNFSQTKNISQEFTPSKALVNVNNKATQFLETLKAKMTKPEAIVKKPAIGIRKETNSIMQLSTEDHTKIKVEELNQEAEDLLSEDCESFLEPNLCEGTGNKETIIVPDEEYVKPSSLKSIKIHFSFDSIKKKLKNMDEPRSFNAVGRKFTAKISPSETAEAEGELKKQITKDMFNKMEIIGQFNLGFIIAYLDSDLFIIDQHATDEKYNFEMLENTCVLQQQPLIQPHVLHLTPVNESILLDNMKIFAENGFAFLVDHTQPPGRKAKLISIPHSKGWDFGKQDIEEMIFMLSDADGVSCRPSRVRKMFASRACRQSVMIGTALNHKQMKKLVVHMGEIEQPWNCPHGRPTIRHLVNLDLLEKLDESFT